MGTYTFRNRKEELAIIYRKSAEIYRLLNIYGETGIGKTRLLNHAIKKISSDENIVIYIDFQELFENRENLKNRFIKEILSQSPDRVEGNWVDVNQVAGEIISQLSDIGNKKEVYLFFDTTEIIQDNREFIEWLEKFIIAPAIRAKNIYLTFAGRVPFKFRIIEARREVKYEHLRPINSGNSARNLVGEILKEKNPKIKDGSSFEQAIDFVLSLSFGHPKLTEKLSEYISPEWPPEDPIQYKQDVCGNFIRPFIDNTFFDNIEGIWKDILWWASILDWFDVTILQRYLVKVDSELVKDKPDYFFIKGVSDLKNKKNIVWIEERGDSMHGVLGEIIKKCLCIMDPVRSNTAYEKANELFVELSEEFPEEYLEHAQYAQEANKYRSFIKEGEKNE